MKLNLRYLPLLSVLLLGVPYASAQSSFDLNIGGGTFHAKGIGGIDNTTFATGCTVGAANPNCFQAPSLSGFFLGFGGGIMATKKFGVNFDATFQPSRTDYLRIPGGAGVPTQVVQTRETFYDVNGIYAPVNQKKVILQLIGGIGAARTSFSGKNDCTGIAVCSSQSQAFSNNTHFQVHAGVGVQLFVTDHVFIRPEFDLHYVPNLDQQFGTNLVPGGMIWLGYSFGDR